MPSLTAMPSLAVIIVSYNVRELLAACLAATYASLDRAPELAASVIVVDNASADGSAEMVSRDFPAATLLVRQDNLGFAGGNNLALRSLGFDATQQSTLSGAHLLHAAPEMDGRNRRGGSPPDLVLRRNPDAEPLGDAIGQMAHFLLSRPDVGGVGAQLQYPDGGFQHGAFRFPGLLQLWFDFFMPRPRRLLESRFNGRYDRRLYTAGEPFPIDFALGAALMLRREAIAAAGLLDESYFMYAEEVDWCWRIQRASFPFYCVPAARVIHHGGASTRQFRTESFLNLWRSRHRLYGRFYGPLRRRAAGWIIRLGMAAEARRARSAAGQKQITGEELAAQLRAIQRVAQLFARGS
jgi:N-acetylglucosaminyl-diphospho-decaprenol L-rhamnosyltransferase